MILFYIKRFIIAIKCMGVLSQNALSLIIALPSGRNLQ